MSCPSYDIVHEQRDARTPTLYEEISVADVGVEETKRGAEDTDVDHEDDKSTNVHQSRRTTSAPLPSSTMKRRRRRLRSHQTRTRCVRAETTQFTISKTHRQRTTISLHKVANAKVTHTTDTFTRSAHLTLSLSSRTRQFIADITHAVPLKHARLLLLGLHVSRRHRIHDGLQSAPVF